MGKNFKRISVLVNDMKINNGEDVAKEVMSILNEVHGDDVDWLGQYDHFKATSSTPARGSATAKLG